MSSGRESWESVLDRENDNEYTSRLRVPGGWLYRYERVVGGQNIESDVSCGVALCFVPEKVEEEDDA